MQCILDAKHRLAGTDRGGDAGAPAIDGGRTRICNQDANRKDQNGDARFYDGNGDGEFACDSGPVEYQGLLANPGFEKPLNGAGDWTLVASGGGDGRVASATTPNGKFALTFQANSASESVTQSRPTSSDDATAACRREMVSKG